ncbi:hypothetical protein CEXT_85881, partial [Caerostris extrusa]
DAFCHRNSVIIRPLLIKTGCTGQQCLDLSTKRLISRLYSAEFGYRRTISLVFASLRLVDGAGSVAVHSRIVIRMRTGQIGDARFKEAKFVAMQLDGLWIGWSCMGGLIVGCDVNSFRSDAFCHWIRTIISHLLIKTGCTGQQCSDLSTKRLISRLMNYAAELIPVEQPPDVFCHRISVIISHLLIKKLDVRVNRVWTLARKRLISRLTNCAAEFDTRRTISLVLASFSLVDAVHFTYCDWNGKGTGLNVCPSNCEIACICKREINLIGEIKKDYELFDCLHVYRISDLNYLYTSHILQKTV